MPRKIHYRMLFPFTVMAPYTYLQHFTPLMTAVLSFSKTVELPPPLPSDKPWQVGETLAAQIDGVKKLVAINVTPGQDETKVLLVGVEQASSLMLGTLYDNHWHNVEENSGLISSIMMARLRPIHDAIMKETEKPWTRDGENGLFILDTDFDTRPINPKFVHEDWK